MSRSLRFALPLLLACSRGPLPPPAEDSAPAAPPATRTRTCSELHVALAPGSRASVRPAEALRLAAAGLEGVDALTIGGVPVGMLREGAVVSALVPPMLASGQQRVEARAGRCFQSLLVQVQRGLVLAQRGSGVLSLLDERTLRTEGTVDTELRALAQVQWALDGRSLFLRDEAGTVRLLSLEAPRRALTLSTRATGPFVLAQSVGTPTLALVAIPGEESLLRVDTRRLTTTPLEGLTREPLWVAAPLDGSRALTLTRAGLVDSLPEPFVARASRSGAELGPSLRGAPAAPGTEQRLRAPRSFAVAEGGEVARGHGPLGAALDGTEPATLVPMSALTGQLGARIDARDAVGNVQFISGDVLVMDSRTPEALFADITALTGHLTRLPLVGEARGGVARTVTARSQYVVGALVLRGAGPNPEASALHVLDAHYEPPREVAQLPTPGARGMVGILDERHPFILWSSRSLLRVDALPSGPRVERRFEATEPEVLQLAAQP